MEDRSSPATDTTPVQASVLVCFDNPHPAHPYEVEHIAEEFSHLCPFTGQPDIATLAIHFTPSPKGKCVELKSLKLYLHQYRNVRISYEQLINVVADHLFEAMLPKVLYVTGLWKGRGGIRSSRLHPCP